MDHAGAPTSDRVLAGRYRLQRELGRGGTGIVWQAEDVVLGRVVAVKEVLVPLQAPAAEQDLLRERTMREARAAARLESPAVVTVFDVVEVDGRPFIVMELVDGRTLSEVVRADGALPVAEAARIGLAVLDALAAAHAAGIVHRDVKPSNVLVTPGGRVVLTDFGIAQSLGDPSLTSTGLLVGSPGYVAPERIAGRAAGPAADLWGLGAMLFTAVEGRPAYEQGEVMATLLAVARDDRAAAARAGALGPALDRLLEPDPERRAGVPEARALLTDALGGRTSTFPAPQPATVPVARAAAPPSVAPPPALNYLAQPTTAPTRHGSSRRLAAPLVAALLLLTAAGAGAVVLLNRGGGGAAAGAARPTATATAGAAASPASRPAGSPTAAPTPASPTTGAPGTGTPTGAGQPQTSTAAGGSGPAPAGVPAGWQGHAGPAGSTVYLPPGWTQRDNPAGPQFVEPGTGTSIVVAYAPVGKGDPVADWQSQATSAPSRFTDYRTVSIAGVEYRGFPTADWEFTYRGGHALDRGFVANGHGQALFLQSTPQGYPAARRLFDTVAASFRPAP